MPSNEFNEWVDRIADSVKQVVGPFGGLLNPQSSQATQAEIDRMKARIERQDRLLDTQLDTISQKTRELRAAETERDALRAQLGGERGVFHDVTLAKKPPEQRKTEKKTDDE